MKNIPIDYVTKDYEGFFQMMKQAIPLLAPEWTNTSDSDQGIVILQQLAYGLHVLGYYEDKGVAEGFLETARTRKSILKGARYLGYDPYMQNPSVVTLEFEKEPDSLNKDVTIAARTQVGTDPILGTAIIFETDTTITIPAGQLKGTVTATQGITITGEDLGSSNGRPGQEYRLLYPNALQDTFVLQTEENGALYNWRRVDSFIDSTATSRDYISTVDDDNMTTIMFGDGLSGTIPPLGAYASITYRAGGGIFGNVGSNKIIDIPSNLIGIKSVTNPSPAQGGSDPEPLESIKSNAPKWYRTRARAVTAPDFEDIAELQTGVHAAKCIETYNANSDVQLYIATTDGSAPTAALKNKIKQIIEDVMIMNQNLLVLDAAYVDRTLDVSLVVKSNTSNAEMQAKVDAALRAQYGPLAFKFGDSLYLSEIVRIVKNLDDRILDVVVNSPATNVTPTATQIPRITAFTVTVTGGV